MPVTACSRSLPRQGLHDAVEMWRVAAEGLLDYWVGAANRPGELPLDVVRFWSEVANRRAPEWSTPHEMIRQWPIARLRDFSDGSDDAVTPTLVLPPQAGHDSCIVDFSPEQSQMQTIRQAGLTRAFSLDWIGATPATKDATIDDYLEVIDQSIELLGGRVNLIGDCQGGWLATLYAGLHPERVNTLTIAGAPIDFHCGEPLIHAWVEAMRLDFYRALVAAGGGVLKGRYMLAGFVALEPQAEVSKHMQLIVGLGEAGFLARHRRFENWYKQTQDIPGGFYLWIVEHLFRNNELCRGELQIGGEKVDLTRIECPVNLIAGAKDHITPPDQVYALADVVSTPEKRIRRRLSDGGHLGLFMSHEALQTHWPPVLRHVYEHSQTAAVASGSAR
jgi:poly(3-hydroxybutyrate) depolymerase